MGPTPRGVLCSQGRLPPSRSRTQALLVSRQRRSSARARRSLQLRERGIVLYGPDPKELIDPVAKEDLRRESMDGLREYAEWTLSEPLRVSCRLFGLSLGLS